jgi:site-specific DNA recombinase
MTVPALLPAAAAPPSWRSGCGCFFWRIAMLKAIIYARVSTPGQAEEGTSLETQEAVCLKRAHELGAEIVGILADEGISGALFLSRPGIQKALAAIEEGRANTLITMKLDRSGRDVDDLREIRRRIRRAGGQIIFADGMNFEDNAIGNLMYTQMAAFAEFEKELIRERTMNGKREKAAKSQQQPARSRDSWGYHVVTHADVIAGRYPASEIGRYQIKPETADLVRELFRRYAGGQSMRALATWLHSAGIPAPYGGERWHISSIRDILCNPLYKGKPEFGQTYRVNIGEERLQDGYKLTFVQRPTPADRKVVLSAPALVSPEVWQACQERLAANRAYNSNPKWVYPLSGLLRCPSCRYCMIGRNRNMKKRYYLCKYTTQFNICSYTRHYRADELEAEVVAAVIYLIEHPDWAAQAIRAAEAAQQATQTEEAALRRYRREWDDLIAREQATVEAQVAGIQAGVDTGVYLSLLQQIAARKQELQEIIRQAEARREAAPLEAAPWLAQLRRAALALRLPALEPALLRQRLAGIIQTIIPATPEAGLTITFQPMTLGQSQIVYRQAAEGIRIEIARFN